VIFDIQINQGAAPWSVVRAALHDAETAGFANVWVLDHISSFGDADISMLECFTTLGAIAESTSTIGLGSLVANAQLRNPSLLAACATSLQNISGGRFTLGIGAGAASTGRWSSEMKEMGIVSPTRMAERHEHLLQVLATCRSQWSGEKQNMPKPITPPPVILGVNSVELAEIAVAIANGMNIRSNHPKLEEIVSGVRSKTEDRPDWSTSVWAMWDTNLLNDGDSRVNRWAELGIDRVVLVWTPKAGSIGEIGRVNQ
jgi:alkanesulfonate monooxygenase SsuD/methylene tetrahydromethanopterin reductase-like flavin-dependent oxidoreductase (luciferase family)